jgi:hypothetical protein
MYDHPPTLPTGPEIPSFWAMFRPVTALRHRLPALALLAAAALTTAPASAQKTDVVQLRDGSSIIGEVKEMRQNRIRYSTNGLSTVQVEWDRVMFLQSRHLFEVETSGGRRLYGSLANGDAARLLVVAGDTLNMTQVVAITPMNPSFWDRTNGYLDAGFTATRANDTRTFNAGAEGKYVGRTWNHTLTYSGYYQSQTNNDPILRTSVSYRVARRLSGIWAVTGRTIAEQNDELNLDLRTQAALGMAHNTVRRSHFELYLQALLQGGQETFKDADAGVDPTFSLDLLLITTVEGFKWASPKLDSRTNLSLIPSLTEDGRWRVELDTRTSYEIYNNLFLAGSIKYSFDSKSPGSGARQEDWTFSFSVGWSWS